MTDRDFTRFRDLSAVSSATHGRLDAGHRLHGVLLDHPDARPAQFVRGPLIARCRMRYCAAIDAVLLAVVLDGEHQVLPTHVEVVPPFAVGAQHWYLRLRPREARSNHQAAAARFPSAMRRRHRTDSSAVAVDEDRGNRDAAAQQPAPLRLVKPVALPSASSRATASSSAPRRPMSNAVRSPASSRAYRRASPNSSDAQPHVVGARCPRAGRAFGQINSIGAVSSHPFGAVQAPTRSVPR